jgi:hypothetical protein
VTTAAALPGGGGGGGVLTVTVADPLFVLSATLVAVTVCWPVVDGAVYKPDAEIVPTVLLPPVIASTDQVTAVFDVPVTVAWNCCAWPVLIVADFGLRATEMLGGGGGGVAVTVTVALALFVVSAWLVAVTTCWPALDGAVYRPAVEMVPTVALPPVMVSTDHVTAVFCVPVTAAWNCCVAPAAMLADVGLIEMATLGGGVVTVTETVAFALFVVSAALVADTTC